MWEGDRKKTFPSETMEGLNKVRVGRGNQLNGCQVRTLVGVGCVRVCLGHAVGEVCGALNSITVVFAFQSVVFALEISNLYWVPYV